MTRLDEVEEEDEERERVEEGSTRRAKSKLRRIWQSCTAANTPRPSPSLSPSYFIPLSPLFSQSRLQHPTRSSHTSSRPRHILQRSSSSSLNAELKGD